MQLANFINSGRLFFRKSDLSLAFTVALGQAIKRALPHANAIELANIFNGSLNLGIIDKNFLEQINTPSEKKKSQVLAEQISYEFSTSIARFEFYCQKVLKINFFGNDFLSGIAAKISNQKISEEKMTATYQQAIVANCLQEQGFKINQEQLQFHQDLRILVTDIVATKDGIDYYIEVDGSTHFTLQAGERETENQQTLIRNQIYQALITEKNNNKTPNQNQAVFLILPNSEINKFANNQYALEEYLGQKLQQAKLGNSNSQSSNPNLEAVANDNPSQTESTKTSLANIKIPDQETKKNPLSLKPNLQQTEPKTTKSFVELVTNQRSEEKLASQGQESEWKEVVSKSKKASKSQKPNYR